MIISKGDIHATFVYEFIFVPLSVIALFFTVMVTDTSLHLPTLVFLW